jgi:hypothetical protein
MDYKYDIFISYKWGDERKKWVDEILRPILISGINEVIDKKILTPEVIFKDTDNVPKGATLDVSLQKAVAFSKCMVCVVSLPYFKASAWCPTEFSAMLHREIATGIRSTGNYMGLIFPIIFVEEKEATPEKKSPVYEYAELRKLIFGISPLELDYEKYNRVSKSFKDSDEYDELRNIIRRWVRDSIRPQLERINNNYPWKSEWDTPQYLLDPYQNFKDQYCSPPPPPPNPSIA